MDDQQLNHIKGAVEALLFVSEKAVKVEQLKEVLPGTNAGDIKKAIKTLCSEYKERSAGMMIIEIANGYQMLSSSQYAEYIRDFYKSTAKEKLSKPALESLAIIAYKQPVSRSDIEEIRGVNSDGVVTHLLNKNLIKIVGRKEIPGRPYLYGTTTQFLEYFGLKNLEDLPNLEDFQIEDQEEIINSHTAKAEMQMDARGQVQGGQEDDQDIILNDDDIQTNTPEDLAKQVQENLKRDDIKQHLLKKTRDELQKAINEMDEMELPGEPSGQSRIRENSMEEAQESSEYDEEGEDNAAE